MSLKFVTLATYEPPPAWTGSREDFVERSGYQTLEQQVALLQASGERLQDWRQLTYPGEGEASPVPVFLDKIGALDQARALRAKMKSQYDEFVAAEVKAKADAEAAKDLELQTLRKRLAETKIPPETEPK